MNRFYFAVKLCSVIFILFPFVELSSFAFEDDTFLIDVMISETNGTTIYGENLLISEIFSPFRKEISGTYTIKLESYFSEDGFRIESTKPFLHAQKKQKQKLELEKNNLLIKNQTVFESDEFFVDEAEAQEFLSSNNIKGDTVNSKNCISEAKLNGNEQLYLTLPLKISGNISIKIDDEYLSYENEIFVYADDSKLILVNRIPMETYLLGVVGNEIGNNSPLQALKAQAVAARTKAYKTIIQSYSKSDMYDLDATTKFQVFRGINTHNDNIEKAVELTKDEIIFYGDELIDAVFSSCCGGRTEDNSNVWKGTQLDYLSSISDGMNKNWDLSNEWSAKKWIDKTEKANCSYHQSGKEWEKKLFNWKKTIPNYQLANSLKLGYIKKIKILDRGKSGRILKMKIYGKKGNRIISNQAEIRRLFGNARSSFFYVKSIGENIKIVGKGSGHGVGMCQIGMINKTRNGQNYRQVLQFYYPQTKLKKIYIKK